MPSEERKKIAVVIPKYGLIGGAEQFAKEMTERLALDPRFEIHVFANQWQHFSDMVTFHKVPFFSFPKFLTTVSFASRAARKIREAGCELIHTHERIWNAHIFTMHGIPHRLWVKDIRGKKIMSLFDYATVRVEKHLVEKSGCRRFFAVSNVARESFLKEYSVEPDHLEVMSPGVNTTEFMTLNRDACRLDIRKRYGIVSNHTVILFVSMNFDIKGLEALIAATGRLKADSGLQDISILVVGKGDEKKYKQIARAWGVEKQVVFAGVIEKTLLPRFYLAGDVLGMLSRFDTFGMVVLEAMAASLPVIVSRNVGARDIVTNGGNGFVIENIADIEKIADAIRCLHNKVLRAKMSLAAWETAQEHSWERVAEKMLTAYEAILCGR